MASNQRRRERYAQDETYRERRLREVMDRREAARAEREKIRRLRGWHPIATAPDNEMIILYDPKVFWPVVASMDNGHWKCVHYEGPPLRPTHWRHILEIPLP